MRRLIVAAAVVGICIFAAGCHGQSNQGTKASTTTATTNTKPPPPPVAEAALKGFPPSPEQINAVMGATDMKVTKSRTAMSDDSATMTPNECLAIDGSAQAQVYAGSGFMAERDQTLDRQEGDNFDSLVEQAVVLFPNRQASRRLLHRLRPAVAGVPRLHPHPVQAEWTVGAISNTNGVLSTISTLQNPPSSGWKPVDARSL